MTVSRCRKLWCPKCWNQLVENFYVYLHAKSELLQSLLSFLTYCKEIPNLLFWAIWICLATHLKWCYQFEVIFDVYLLTKNKRFPWYITNILQTCYFGNFGHAWLPRNTKLVILGNLDTPGHTPKVMLSIWRNFWCLSADQKSTFSLIYHKDITNLLFWELWTCMVTQHPKWYYQLVENVCAYLSAKGLNSSPRFSGDVVKISKLLILGRLDMPGYAHPNW